MFDKKKIYKKKISANKNDKILPFEPIHRPCHPSHRFRLNFLYRISDLERAEAHLESTKRKKK